MTKADFYIGNGIAANWIGSIREDGYPRGISLEILICTNPTLYEELVVDFIHEREGVVKTEGGKWPWLWPDSRMTDYSYMFLPDHSKVFASNYGGLGRPVFPLKEARAWTESCLNYTEIMDCIQTTGTSRKQ